MSECFGGRCVMRARVIIGGRGLTQRAIVIIASLTILCLPPSTPLTQLYGLRLCGDLSYNASVVTVALRIFLVSPRRTATAADHVRSMPWQHLARRRLFTMFPARLPTNPTTADRLRNFSFDPLLPNPPGCDPVTTIEPCI